MLEQEVWFAAAESLLFAQGVHRRLSEVLSEEQLWLVVGWARLSSQGGL